MGHNSIHKLIDVSRDSEGFTQNLKWFGMVRRFDSFRCYVTPKFLSPGPLGQGHVAGLRMRVAIQTYLVHKVGERCDNLFPSWLSQSLGDITVHITLVFFYISLLKNDPFRMLMFLYPSRMEMLFH